MVPRRPAPWIAVLAAFGAAGAPATGRLPAQLATDDECRAAVGDEGREGTCSLSALQLRAGQSAVAVARAAAAHELEADPQAVLAAGGSDPFPDPHVVQAVDANVSVPGVAAAPLFSCSVGWPSNSVAGLWQHYCRARGHKAWAMTPACTSAKATLGRPDAVGAASSAAEACAEEVGEPCPVFDVDGSACRFDDPEEGPAFTCGVEWPPARYARSWQAYCAAATRKVWAMTANCDSAWYYQGEPFGVSVVNDTLGTCREKSGARCFVFDMNGVACSLMRGTPTQEPRDRCDGRKIRPGSQGCCMGKVFKFSTHGCCGGTELFRIHSRGCCYHEGSPRGPQVFNPETQNCCDVPDGVCTIKTGQQLTCCKVEYNVYRRRYFRAPHRRRGTREGIGRRRVRGNDAAAGLNPEDGAEEDSEDTDGANVSE